MNGWMSALNGDPLPWLLAEETPAVRHLALRLLLDRPAEDPEVVAARTAAMAARPIAAILAGQQPEGYWVQPGAGYSAKFKGTVWQVIFLDQLGADPTDPRVRAACDYVLEHGVAPGGGFSLKRAQPGRRPPDNGVAHCLNGNLLAALVGMGRLEDARVQAALAWEVAAITGEGQAIPEGAITTGAGFQCRANGGHPCAWGAIKALRALARVPVEQRTARMQRAIDQGAAFLLSADPARAAYPDKSGGRNISPAWFKLGFPSAYAADVLQNLEVLCDLGYSGDARLRPALDWLRSKQDAAGRWKNENAYNGRTSTVLERQGEPSKWVTLRACRVLRAAFGNETASQQSPPRARILPLG